MTEHDILDAIGDIDPAYLEEAKRASAPKRLKWVGFGSLAACLLLLIFPLAYRHWFLSMAEASDYAPTSSQECSVYFVWDGALYYETVDISGGDAEMLEAWASKNGIEETLDLREVSVILTPTEDGGFDACVTVSASIAAYFENEEGALRRDSLKRTVASYHRDLEIRSLSIVYS